MGCILCRRSGYGNKDPNSEVTTYICFICGEFSTVYEFERLTLPQITNDGRTMAALSAATKQSSLPLRLDTKNWQGYADAHLNVPVARKEEKLLEALRAASTNAGAFIPFHPSTWYPLVDAASEQECSFIAYLLIQQGLAEHHGQRPDGVTLISDCKLRLSGAGWAKLEALGAVSQSVAFVAMWFDNKKFNSDEVFSKAIQPAIEIDCGFTQAIRVDKEHFGERIDDRIIANIRRCRFVVADFTGHRGGVYFEAGFAMGLGKPVLWTCRDNQIRKAHFDTRQFPHLVWSDTADLRRKLTEHIRARIPGAKLT